ncbi:MAG TPA: tRNA-dihydrouridine synthase family protein, partial [Spirochaetota bacterium]|nr:tRNA-dihydrouridine synthase family protein [Spirochaetota bacterium]
IFGASFSGIELAVAPFITNSVSEKKINDVSPAGNINLKTIPQILTGIPEDFIALGKRLADSGSDRLNWNLGCPFRKVLDRNEGAAILTSPQRIEQFLEKVFRIELPLISVKMRLGRYSSDEIFKVLEIMNNYPIDQIIIHARTAEQMYNGEINLSFFNEALKISKHPVIYNGDITHKTDINNLNSKTSDVSGWMAGRGILMNPFLAEEITVDKIIPDNEKISRIRTFTDKLFEAYCNELDSPAHILDKIKGVWTYLVFSFENGNKIIKKIKKAKSINHYKDEIKRIFDSELIIITPVSRLYK